MHCLYSDIQLIYMASFLDLGPKCEFRSNSEHLLIILWLNIPHCQITALYIRLNALCLATILSYLLLGPGNLSDETWQTGPGVPANEIMV